MIGVFHYRSPLWCYGEWRCSAARGLKLSLAAFPKPVKDKKSCPKFIFQGEMSARAVCGGAGGPGEREAGWECPWRRADKMAQGGTVRCETAQVILQKSD